MINRYEVIEEKRNWNKPYIDKNNRYLIIPRPKKTMYSHYLLVRQFNEMFQEYEYFILLGCYAFDESAHKCYTDDWGRLKVIPRGSFKQFIETELKSRQNLEIEELKTEEKFDIYKIY